MSGTFRYENVFRVIKSDATRSNTQSRPRKRNRKSVSCLACRTHKLKCSREVPCTSCLAKGIGESCRFSDGNDEFTESRSNVHDEGSKNKTSEAQVRLQRLEEMVADFMQTTSSAPTSHSESHRQELSQRHPAISTVVQQPERFPVDSSLQTPEGSSVGRLEIHESESNYLGANHWMKILEKIRDIQVALEPEAIGIEDVAPPSLDDSHEFGILSPAQPLTLKDFQNSLPARHTTDKLLYLYFSVKYIRIPIIHSGKFLREYESFWADPSSVTFLWVSILFSALYLGSQISRTSGQEVNNSPGHPESSELLARANQALVAGKYNTARQYSVEAILLYAHCKFLQKEDPDSEAWMLMGTSTRLALRMGYHRDPRNQTHISPFEGEMRRRTFLVLENLDLLISFQLGLPVHMMNEEECDTEPPSNLFDEDFDENCKTLPHSRPITDSTPMLYFCYKNRLVRVFRHIIRHSLSLRRTSYDDALKLDSELQEVHADIPISLRRKPLSASFTDQAQTIMHRINIDLLYLKSLCVLHRNYLTFDYSRKTSTSAALQILRHQSELHFALQPGGQFDSEKCMLTSLTLNDFLMASMILCLDLYESQQESAMTSPETLQAQIEKHAALSLSHSIWVSRREFSREARNASNILAFMLSRVPSPNKSPTSTNAPHPVLANLETSMHERELTEPFQRTSENTSWGTSNFDLPSQEFTVDSASSGNTLNQIFNGFENINWGLVDQYLLDPHDFLDYETSL